MYNVYVNAENIPMIIILSLMILVYLIRLLKYFSQDIETRVFSMNSKLAYEKSLHR